jgi:uncharacterized membrane protein
MGIISQICSLLLVFSIPGYFATQLLLSRAYARAWHYFAYSLGTSVLVVTIGGLALHWTAVGITRTAWLGLWALYLGVLSLLLLWIRGQEEEAFITITVPWFSALPQIIPLLLGLGIVVIALYVNHRGAIEAPSTSYTELWLIPESKPNAERAFLVGVRNAEQVEQNYILQARLNEELLYEWDDLEMMSLEVWQERLEVPQDKQGILRLELRRADQPNEIYRYVFLPIGERSN